MGYILLAAGVGTPMGNIGSYLPKAMYPTHIYILNDLNYESRLGSSGALLISLLNVLHWIRGSKNTAIRELIDKASFIEVEVFGGAGGYHDHSICALGGLRYIRYKNGYESDIEPVPNAMDLEKISDRLVLFYTCSHTKTKPSLEPDRRCSVYIETDEVYRG